MMTQAWMDSVSVVDLDWSVHVTSIYVTDLKIRMDKTNKALVFIH